MRYQHGITSFRFIPVFLGAVLTAVAEPSLTELAHQRLAMDAVQRALAAASHGTHLLAADLADQRLTINLSRELLDLVPGSFAFEAATAAINRAAGDVLGVDLSTFEIYLLIDGVPLQNYLPADSAPRTPSIVRQVAPTFQVPGAHALAGRRIAISPGHGYYLINGTSYVLQRPYLSGIVEDFINHDIITHLNTLLVAEGADVRPTRNLDRTAGLGESGFPKWQEAARYHVKALGADPSVWNESGFTHLDQDIRCRPRYANSVAADLLVSVHNNAGGGTGTETLYDTNNGFGTESKRLADILHAKVIGAIRRDYNAAWTDRRVQGFNGSYGENRLATRPAVLMEIAFMDKPTPDNAALQDDRFRLLVATAIRDGIREYLEGPAPAAPTALLATGDATGVSLSWVDTATNENSFFIERKIFPSGVWAPLATVAANVVAHRDATAAPGTAYVYRVQAINAGGNPSSLSNEATAALVVPPLSLVIANVAPSATQTADLSQDMVFTLTVTDSSGRPVPNATILVTDGIRNVDTVVTSTTADASGQTTIRSTVPVGQANGTYAFTFQATKSGYVASPPLTRQAQVSHASSARGAPTLATQPTPLSVTAGTTATLRTSVLGAAPLSYQWRFNGGDLAGATDASLVFANVTPAQAGNYAVVVTNNSGSATSLTVPVTVNPAAWLSNVSLRTTLAAGQNVIVGFVVNGAPKDLLIRAAGPALAAFGLTSAMADPRLELYGGSIKITENNDWMPALAPTFSSLGAFPFAAASRDAALLQSLSGPHTVQVTGTAGGVVLVEGYDAGHGNAARLINLSARNRVGTGADVLIAGFFVAGTGTRRVLIRAVGPTLAALGVTGTLADPQLEVTGTSGRIASNDNWDAALASTFARVGAFPLPAGSKDAAVVVTLDAGRSYTVQVSGVASGVGEALVEVYEVP